MSQKLWKASLTHKPFRRRGWWSPGPLPGSIWKCHSRPASPRWSAFHWPSKEFCTACAELHFVFLQTSCARVASRQPWQSCSHQKIERNLRSPCASLKATTSIGGIPLQMDKLSRTSHLSFSLQNSKEIAKFLLCASVSQAHKSIASKANRPLPGAPPGPGWDASKKRLFPVIFEEGREGLGAGVEGETQKQYWPEPAVTEGAGVQQPVCGDPLGRWGRCAPGAPDGRERGKGGGSTQEWRLERGAEAGVLTAAAGGTRLRRPPSPPTGKRLRAAGYLIEGCSQLSVYSVTKRLRRWKAATGDVCYSAVKEVYFWERVHTLSIPSAWGGDRRSSNAPPGAGRREGERGTAAAGFPAKGGRGLLRLGRARGSGFPIPMTFFNAFIFLS